MISNSATTTLSDDEIFELLANPRRRFVLLSLRESGQAIPLTDIADSMAGASRDVGVSGPDRAERKRAYVSLYQTHIPSLVDAGVVTYDADSGFVALTDRANMLFPFLDLSDHDDDWAMRYLIIAVVGLVVYVPAAFVGTPSQLAVIGMIFLASVLLVGVFHRRAVRPSIKRRTKRRMTRRWA
ncbi:DUF7344 domain-containing protein [Halorubrum vacuolatum]|uniref:DUF7344 domain-containing protein n=1 Tax=Halorubrum vacuolatum TaxID=63740 RepID=A0A238X971_HALVU|nr:hypothetical protein [Halorubrum vacuolatum]SNR55148.1 hypothetical protein SAMN06264855_11479 [Halorubrum vacuolatum]